MIASIDTATVQPLPRAAYVDQCVVEDNPWRPLFHTGTAGTTTEFFCAERLANGATYQFVKLASGTSASPSVAHHDLDTIIDLMKPSMSQLAAALGVSRQRIYDWRNGEGMSATNSERMSSLLTAARILSERSSIPSRVANRKLSGGNTFWDALAAGISPSDAAASVVKLLDRDESERSALKRSLARHAAVRVKEPSLFSAHLSE